MQNSEVRDHDEVNLEPTVAPKSEAYRVTDMQGIRQKGYTAALLARQRLRGRSTPGRKGNARRLV